MSKPRIHAPCLFSCSNFQVWRFVVGVQPSVTSRLNFQHFLSFPWLVNNVSSLLLCPYIYVHSQYVIENEKLKVCLIYLDICSCIWNILFFILMNRIKRRRKRSCVFLLLPYRIFSNDFNEAKTSRQTKKNNEFDFSCAIYSNSSKRKTISKIQISNWCEWKAFRILTTQKPIINLNRVGGLCKQNNMHLKNALCYKEIIQMRQNERLYYFVRQNIIVHRFKNNLQKALQDKIKFNCQYLTC